MGAGGFSLLYISISRYRWKGGRIVLLQRFSAFHQVEGGVEGWKAPVGGRRLGLPPVGHGVGGGGGVAQLSGGGAPCFPANPR